MLDTTQIQKALYPVDDPAFPVIATLYFIEGHYLFRYMEKSGLKTKFLTPGDLAAAFSQNESDSGWLPAGLVRCGDSAQGPWFVYSAPAQKMNMILDTTGKEEITAPIPRTVLLGIGNTYYLWALKSRYFDPGERFYHAPFPNIHMDGRICWGTNTPKPASPMAARSVWEMFFYTPFNQDLTNGKSNEYQADVRAQLRNLAKKNARTYPAIDLVESGRSIGFEIENLIRRTQ